MTVESDGAAGTEKGSTGSEEAREGDGRIDGADLLERTIVVLSVLLVAATLGYVLWQASVTPSVADPEASVESIEPVTGTDRLRVTVGLDNERGPGLTSAQVVVRCGGAERSLEFEHVPAGGTRTGTVTCPAGTDPDAAVETWVEA